MMMAAMRVVDLVTADDNKKYELAGRMADAIIDLTCANGGCLPQDLNARGFTPYEVDEHWHMAKSLAAVEIKYMRNNPVKPKNIFGRS